MRSFLGIGGLLFRSTGSMLQLLTGILRHAVDALWCDSSVWHRPASDVDREAGVRSQQERRGQTSNGSLQTTHLPFRAWLG